MIGSIVLGLFGAFCWWLGVLGFSTASFEGDTKGTWKYWVGQAATCILPCVAAFFFGIFSVAALVCQMLINLYVLRENLRPVDPTAC